MQDYQPNSHKYKEQQQKNSTEEPRTGKVISGTARVKKKGEISKFATSLIAEDATNVKSYIVTEVILPTIKKTIVDIVQDAVSMIFLGTTGRGKSGSKSSYVSYASYSDRSRDDRRSESRVVSSRFNLDDIFFETSKDAIAVREQLYEIADTYPYVSVADLYDCIQETAPHTANKYGWTKESLRNVDVLHTRDGWILKLPKPMPIG